MTIEEARQRVSGVEGWLTESEGKALFGLARDFGGRGAIAEVGSWKGRSKVWLACGSLAGAGGKVFAIDPHTGSPEHQATEPGAQEVWTFDEFQRNMRDAGVADLVSPLVMTSLEAARDFAQPIGLIFIDGAHEYEAVRDDFEAWFPKVVDGGIMAFNDADSWPGVFRLVDEQIVRSRRFRNLRLVDSTLIAQKVAANRLADRMRNRYVRFLMRMSQRGRKARLPRGLAQVGKRVLRGAQGTGARA